MLWAALVGSGVAIVSMAIFAARITKRPGVEDGIVEDIGADVDPADPWAAWKPRPIEQMDRPRRRVWPALAALTGFVLVGAGIAGARQTLWSPPQAAPVGLGQLPNTVQVEVTAPPTLSPTPAATDAPVPLQATTAPRIDVPAATPVASTPATSTGTGPSITASASCGGGVLRFSYTAGSAGGLSWLAVYADGKVVKGGPISGTSYSSGYSHTAAKGTHALEISVQDKAGRTSRKQYAVTC